jgi:excisionase family DNA binding protein
MAKNISGNKEAPRNAEMSDLISQTQAAEVRGVSREAIHRLIKRGKLRTVEVGGRPLLYRNDVENFEPEKAGRPPKTKGRGSKD